MKRIGISADGGKTCALWCEVDKTVKDRIYFTVINGAWSGTIKDGVLTIPSEREVQTQFPAQICWTDEIPEEHDTGYNDVITWIDKQLTKSAK